MPKLTVDLLLPNQVEVWCHVKPKTPPDCLIAGYGGVSLMRENKLYDLSPDDPLVLKGIRLAGLVYSALLLGAVRARERGKEALHPSVLNNGVVSWEGGLGTLQVIEDNHETHLTVPDELLAELRKSARSLVKEWVNKDL
jgi:hypothetical protein